MPKLIFFSLLVLLTACNNPTTTDTVAETKKINATVDAWHNAAAHADFNNYFQYLTEDAVFIGTDATENWHKKEFAAFSKPYFDKGKAWNFTPLERHIFFDKTGQTAWFDELLNTQMKICRGSGVLTNIAGEWKINQYVLSMTMPNDKIVDVLKLKTVEEDSIINKLQKK